MLFSYKFLGILESFRYTRYMTSGLTGKKYIYPQNEGDLVVSILRNRNIEHADRIFIEPTINDLHDPYLFPGMKESVDRVLLARKRGESGNILRLRRRWSERYNSTRQILHRTWHRGILPDSSPSDRWIRYEVLFF